MLLLKVLGVALVVAGVTWGVVRGIRWARRHRGAAAGGAAGMIADSSYLPVPTGGLGERLGNWLDDHLSHSDGPGGGGGFHGDDGGDDGGGGDGD